MMKMLVRPSSTKPDSYIDLGCNSFLFGIKDFSSFSTCDVTIKELTNIIDKYNLAGYLYLLIRIYLRMS